jgi:hypothetical protein
MTRIAVALTIEIKCAGVCLGSATDQAWLMVINPFNQWLMEPPAGIEPATR